jgi:phosphoenolpyruvate-protein phosphotransferase/dihydroxyacetone kinase phosphotransfer subunit
VIGIVIVSHSARLAEGAAELAHGMAGPEARLVAVGGLDLPERPLGTDAALILQAVEQVYSDDGVLILMDLGSALLSAEMALDMLTPERRVHVLLCDAPLVEGAIAAAVQARLGASLEQAAAEARAALGPKIAHLKPESPAVGTAAPPTAPASGANSHTLRLVVQNRLGLHARPAARLVQTASRFQSNVQITNATTGRGPASARSINAIATLGVRQGHEIEVVASGADAGAALAALRQLADQHFGDTDEDTALPQPEVVPPVSADASRLTGIPASSGVAVGPARQFRLAAPPIRALIAADPQAEWDSLRAAIDQTRQQIETTRAAVARRGDPHAAEIFDAHLLFLDDDALREPARRAIFADQASAAAAWQQAVNAVADQYRALDDEYMRARSADVQDVGQQVLVRLLGGAAVPLTEPGILIANDLTPSDVARLDASHVLGICTASGSPTSHGAILARSLGIPAVVGLGSTILSVEDGTLLALDGDTGQVTIRPHEETADRFRQHMERARAEHISVEVRPIMTRSGRPIEVAANIGSVAEARAAVAAGADGVGVLRTEFLFLDRQIAPNEDEQYSAYRAIVEALQGRPMIIRTLDVGGDKPLPYVDQGREANPFLGWRAIRLCLDQPAFFKVQLRAIVRTAAEFPIKVMFPMIATVAEFRQAHTLLAEARAEVIAHGQAAPDRIETGIMVEIPACALQAAQFAPEVDFFSIGTNDLIQYTMAAERGNPRLTTLADGFHPAVLKLIRNVVEAAHAHGKWVGVCGELASDPLAVPLLIGLGVDELSMNAPAIPRAKQIICTLDDARVEATARSALSLETPGEVRALLRS